MRPAFALVLASAGLVAGPAVINGVALENLSSYPLSRARVKLARLSGNRLEPVATQLTSRTGQFVFPGLEPGFYVLTGVRAGFAETGFGERRGGAPSVPIQLKPDQSMFAELRLKRLGAVVGKVLDENRVGLPGVSVSAYASTGVARLVASATSDDRGVFRITGLMPGAYHVRTGAATLDDGLNLLPTYFPFATQRFRDARAVDVDLDRDSTDTDIQPIPGTLVSLMGSTTASGCSKGTPVKATLSHETGRKEFNTVCEGSYSFQDLVPEDYELLIEGTLRNEPMAYFETVSLRRPRDMGAVRLNPLPWVSVKSNVAASELRVVARRTDAAGPGEARVLNLSGLTLPPGHWEVGAVPPPGHYLKDVSTRPPFRGTAAKPDPDWFALDLSRAPMIGVNIEFSPSAGKLAGTAKASGSPAIGAPVYLLPIGNPTRAQVNGLKQVVSDANGRFAFTNLAPGTYLLAGSWELPVASEDTMNSIGAQRVEVTEGSDGSREVEVLGAR